MVRGGIGVARGRAVVAGATGRCALVVRRVESGWGEPRVLLFSEGGQWSLPEISYGNAGWLASDVGEILHRSREEYGLKATVLRHLDDGGRVQVCELESHVERWQPPDGGRWVGSAEISGLRFRARREQEILTSWFADEGEAAPRRAPWEKRGWLNDVETWVEAELVRIGSPALGTLEQVKAAWGGSSVLRIRATTGLFYFKAVYAKPPSEPALLLALAERFQSLVPDIVAADLERRWMLTRDFGALVLDVHPIARWRAAMRTFGALQLAAANHLDRWRAAGVPTEDAASLTAGLEALLADEQVLLRGRNALAPREIEVLRLALPRTREEIAELYASELPPTLHQQDLRGGNIAVTAVDRDGFVYFDWCDTVIAHPFFSINRAIDFVPGRETSGDGTLDHPRDAMRRALRDSYLEAWSGVLPPERLLEHFERARRLNELYQAVRWHREREWLEPESPWGREVSTLPARFLKRVLRSRS